MPGKSSVTHVAELDQPSAAGYRRYRLVLNRRNLQRTVRSRDFVSQGPASPLGWEGRSIRHWQPLRIKIVGSDRCRHKDEVEAELFQRIERPRPEGIYSISDPQGRFQDVPLLDSEPICGCPTNVRRGRGTVDLVSEQDRESMTNLGRHFHPSASDVREGAGATHKLFLRGQGHGNLRGGPCRTRPILTSARHSPSRSHLNSQVPCCRAIRTLGWK